MYIDKLDDTVNEYNKIYDSTNKMKPGDVKSNIYIGSKKEIIDKDPKFKIGDIVRMSKHEKSFAKDYVPNRFKENFVIKKIKNTDLWTYSTTDI